MAPVRLPVSAQAAQAQAEYAGREIGIAGAFGQDEEAAVVDDEEQAAGALTGRPTNPPLAEFEVEGSGAEGEQGDTLAVEFGDVAEGLASEAGAGQIVLVFQEAIELGALVLAEQAHGDAFQNLGFAGCQWH